MHYDKPDRRQIHQGRFAEPSLAAQRSRTRHADWHFAFIFVSAHSGKGYSTKDRQEQSRQEIAFGYCYRSEIFRRRNSTPFEICWRTRTLSSTKIRRRGSLRAGTSLAARRHEYFAGGRKMRHADFRQRKTNPR